MGKYKSVLCCVPSSIFAHPQINPDLKEVEQRFDRDAGRRSECAARLVLPIWDIECGDFELKDFSANC